MPPEIIIFDTEFTTWDEAFANGWSSTGHHHEVFQLAAIRLTKGETWQAAKTFNVLLRPVVNPILSARAVTLTGITQEKLEAEALPTAEALHAFSDFMGNTMALSNGQDINVLAETCGLQRVLMPLDPRRFGSLHDPLYAALKVEVGEFDVREYCSGKVYRLLDVPLATTQVHNALHDVYSLAATCLELEKRGHRILPW